MEGSWDVHFDSFHVTLESANPSCHEGVKCRSGDFSINWCFGEWGNNSHCSSSESHMTTLLQTQMSSSIPQVQIGNAVLSSGHQLPICALPHTVQIMFGLILSLLSLSLLVLFILTGVILFSIDYHCAL